MFVQIGFVHLSPFVFLHEVLLWIQKIRVQQFVILSSDVVGALGKRRKNNQTIAFETMSRNAIWLQYFVARQNDNGCKVHFYNCTYFAMDLILTFLHERQIFVSSIYKLFVFSFTSVFSLVLILVQRLVSLL